MDEEADEKAWQGWDVESDDSSESSGEWMNVDSDDEEGINVSDSEDEKTEKAKPLTEKDGTELGASTPVEVKRISTLATTKVCLHENGNEALITFGHLDPDAGRFCVTTRAAPQRSTKGC